MDWTAPVDIYCERLSSGFWAEPANALTNAAFVAAAIWAAVTARRRGEDNPLVWLLIAMAAAIGVGSFLFHTFANRWSELADVIPIWTFVALYVLVAAHRIGGARPGRVAIIALIVAGLVALIMALGEGAAPPQQPAAPDPLNGSLQYLPTVLAFAWFILVTQRRRSPLRHWVLAAGVTFAVSLAMRTIDRDICTTLPLGTHFLWHLLNGLMIGLMLQILVRARTAPANPPAPAAVGA